MKIVAILSLILALVQPHTSYAGDTSVYSVLEIEEETKTKSYKKEQ